MQVGITGITGFLGSALAEKIAETEPEWSVVPGTREIFSVPDKLAGFAEKCDVVIHFAAVSRSADGEALYRTNMTLARQIFDAVSAAKGEKLLLLGSTTHDRVLPYHRSKREAEKLFSSLAGEKRGGALLMPNTFGPGGKPFYNSVVSTFCCQLAHGETPQILQDSAMELIDSASLCDRICAIIRELHHSAERPGNIRIAPRYSCTVRELLDRLTALRDGAPPRDEFDCALRVTLASYR